MSPFRVPKLQLELVPSQRVVWTLGFAAFLLAASPGVALFAPLAYGLLAALALGMAADALRVPAAVSIARVLPPRFALRRPAGVRYVLENHSALDLHVGLVETPMRTLDVGAEERVVSVPAKSAAELSIVTVPVARGTDRFGTIYAWCETRLGLVRRRFRVASDREIRVYPDLSAVERYGTLNVRNRLIEAGLRRMRMRGAGTEFESVRDYASGDAFRNVDWKATARRGKLMVVQREVERSQDVMLLLDCGRLMTARAGEQRKLDYAVTAALSVASIAALASDRVGAVAFARHIAVARSPRPMRSSRAALFDALCDVEARFEESDYASAFSYVRSRLHRRSLIVLFTDVIDAVAQSGVLGELATLARRHVVVCAFMNDAAVQRVLGQAPETIDDAYRLDVAYGLSRERLVASKILQRAGVFTVDVPAARLSVAAIEEYLRVKSAALI